MLPRLRTDFQQGGVGGEALLGPGGSKREPPIQGMQLYVGLRVHLFEDDADGDGRAGYLHVDGVVAGWNEKRQCWFATYDENALKWSAEMDERSIHDNNVYAYLVQCEQKRIVLHSEYKDGPSIEFTDVIFSGVVAHHFENVLNGNILFDITEVEIEQIVQRWADLFARRKNYAWPVVYDTPEELISFLNLQRIKGFEIGSSFGMTGWVLAENMELRERSMRMEP